MIAVSDTSPLHYLVLLGQETVLRDLYGRVLVPEAVRAELRHPGTPAPVRSWAAELPDWTDTVAPVPAPAWLPRHLGPGETAAVATALERGVREILLDDLPARRAAEDHGLTVRGTLGVILLAGEHRMLDAAETLDRLGQTNFRVSRSLLQAAQAYAKTL